MKKYNLFRSIAIFIQEHKKSKALRGALVSLASLTVFTTTYALIAGTVRDVFHLYEILTGCFVHKRISLMAYALQ